MADSQNDLNKQLKVYAAGSFLSVALGVMCAFLSVRISGFQGFFALGVVSLLLMILGGVLGVYCWRLLYLAYRREASWGAFALGVFASVVPLVLAHEVIIRQ